MTELVAEFSGWNDVSLREAFNRACKDVSEQEDVSVLDVRFATEEGRNAVELAVFAADIEAISVEPCSSALIDLVQRQVADIRMALGVAATGSATVADANSIAAALGAQPAGAIREVVPATGAKELYDHISRWLRVVVAARPARDETTATPAAQAADAIADNLPPSNATPAPKLKLRSRP